MGGVTHREALDLHVHYQGQLVWCGACEAVAPDFPIELKAVPAQDQDLAYGEWLESAGWVYSHIDEEADPRGWYSRLICPACSVAGREPATRYEGPWPRIAPRA
jgi:hypothetical protein